MTRRVKTPTILQMEAVECGAAALAIVLGYYGRFVPLEQLRQDCGISRDGSNAVNILKAARLYGMVAKGFRKAPHELREFKLPFIVFWNFNHFLVVEGFGNNVVYLNDPATGPRRVSEDEFNEAFTGVALTFEPAADFKKGGRKSDLVGALRKRLSGCEVGLTYIVLASLALVLPGLMLPTFIRIFIDNVLIRHMRDWTVTLLIGLFITALLRGALTWLQQLHLTRLEARLAMRGASQFFWHILRLPMEFYAQRFSGDLSARVALNHKVAALLSGELATAIFNVMVMGFYLILMCMYDVRLTAVGVVFASINVMALAWVARQRIDGNRRLLNEQAKLAGISVAGLQIMETIKASGAESDFFTRWAGHFTKLLNVQQSLGLSNAILFAVPPLLTALNTVAILWLGSLRVMAPESPMTIGTLIAYQSLMASFMQPINQLVAMGSMLQEAEGDLNRLDDVLAYRRDARLETMDDPLVSDDDASQPLRLNGRVELRNVSFRYGALSTPVVNQVSLCVDVGQRIAIVGGTGSGKSTLARLLAGLYDPQEGEILLDGQPRDAWPRSVITRSLGHVDSNIVMFEGTVRDNLTLWDSTVPDATIVSAARDACIHRDISARTHSYDSYVGEDGRNFSGGQRQRMEIARALIPQPTILILDEATSALDPVLEKQIDENLRRRGCTQLIVAHRLSTIRDCDLIVVLHEGTIVQQGTHESLMASVGPYASLIRAELANTEVSEVDG